MAARSMHRRLSVDDPPQPVGPPEPKGMWRISLLFLCFLLVCAMAWLGTHLVQGFYYHMAKHELERLDGRERDMKTAVAELADNGNDGSDAKGPWLTQVTGWIVAIVFFTVFALIFAAAVGAQSRAPKLVRVRFLRRSDQRSDSGGGSSDEAPNEVEG